MSLREKIGQMLLFGFQGKTINQDSAIVKSIDEDNLGGVILFDYNADTATFDRNIADKTQVSKLTHDLQLFTEKSQAKHQRPKLPLLISVDYEGGKVNRLRERYGFPATKSAAKVAEGRLEEAKILAAAMADTLEEAGFNLNFAPLVDVNVNPDNPIIGKLERSFSADPEVVSTFAKVYAEAFVKKGIQCAYKHFPGHGSSTGDSHLSFVDVSNTWQPYELKPYQQLSADHCGMIMTAHIVNQQLDPSGLPATLSYKILTTLLRDELHFTGVVITDDMQMKAISDNYSFEEGIVLAVNAGADILLFGNNLSIVAVDPKVVIDLIESKVNRGEITRERIDEAYARIVHLKQSLIRGG